jgi:hypothetical protein
MIRLSHSDFSIPDIPHPQGSAGAANKKGQRTAPLLTWLENRFPPYLPVTPQKQAQVRERAGFCGIRIGLRPMMKHPCFMY